MRRHHSAMDYARRNIMTLSLLAFAVAAFAAEVSGSIPGEAGKQLATVALIAAAVGRAAVRAAEELSGGPAPRIDWTSGEVNAERSIEPATPEVDDADTMPCPTGGCVLEGGAS